VKRQHDYTTKVVFDLLEPQRQRWIELAAENGQNVPWNPAQHRIAELIVLNVALWRVFGTATIAERIGWRDCWDAEEKQRVLEVVKQVFVEGGYAYTSAYQPQNIHRNLEIKARKEISLMAEPGWDPALLPEGREVGSMGLQRVLRMYEESISRATGVWDARIQIIRAAQKGSWQATCQEVAQVKWFGGSGFQAKEIVQDLLSTPLFQCWDMKAGVWLTQCKDACWSPVGPGARRGLNRLKGRDVRSGVNQDRSVKEGQFLEEMRTVFAHSMELWPAEICGEPSVPLDSLHDIQFQLCEFDKYQRILCREGRSRRYVPGEAHIVKAQQHSTEENCDADVAGSGSSLAEHEHAAGGAVSQGQVSEARKKGDREGHMMELDQ